MSNKMCLLILGLFCISLISCKKLRYNETSFRVIVNDKCLGIPMENAGVIYFEEKSSYGFGGVSNKQLDSEIKYTDENGVINFENKLMRKKTGYDYHVNYLYPDQSSVVAYNQTGLVTGDNSDEIIDVYTKCYAWTVMYHGAFRDSIIDSVFIKRNHLVLDCSLNTVCTEGVISGDEVQYNTKFSEGEWYTGTWLTNWIIYCNGELYEYHDTIVMDWGGQYEIIYRL